MVTCQDLVAEDCSDLPEYLEEQEQYEKSDSDAHAQQIPEKVLIDTDRRTVAMEVVNRQGVSNKPPAKSISPEK